jgi:hypothetical protein
LTVDGVVVDDVRNSFFARSARYVVTTLNYNNTDINVCTQLGRSLFGLTISTNINGKMVKDGVIDYQTDVASN